MKKRIIIITYCVFLFSCTQSGRRNSYHQENATAEKTKQNLSVGKVKKTIVKMIKKDGVYQVPIEVNSVKMYFIFDTGAGIVSISETEASFLYKQGSLTDEDILGKANFIDANGYISEGTIINLKTVKVGDRTLTNIQAS